MPSRANRSRTRSSTATSRSSGAPRRPRSGTATSASSTSARSRRTSARGCRTWCSVRTRTSSTGSSAYVGLLFFAQLGPLLFLSTLGGLLADVVDRRRFLVSMQLAQLGFSLLLGGRRDGRPSVARAASRSRVFAVGICERARRARAQRDPADARAAGRPARCGRAGVGADEPVARDRPADRRAHLLAARRGAGVRDQRAHVPVRGDRAALGEVPAPHATRGSPSRGSPGCCRACGSPGATR